MSPYWMHHATLMPALVDEKDVGEFRLKGFFIKNEKPKAIVFKPEPPAEVPLPTYSFVGEGENITDQPGPEPEPIFCPVCKKECKNELSLKIHKSKAHPKNFTRWKKSNPEEIKDATAIPADLPDSPRPD